MRINTLKSRLHSTFNILYSLPIFKTNTFSTMKKTFIMFTAFFIAASFNLSAQTIEEKKDRVIASYLIAFGVLPEQGEIDYWINTSYASQPLSALLGEHKKNITNNQTLQDRAIRNSYQDALGRVPAQSEIETWRPSKLTYSELIDRHVKFLKEYPAEFEKMINLTYKKEFKRDAQKQEIANWKSWGARTYVSIIQEHQKNKRAGMFAENKPSTKLISSKESGVQQSVPPKLAEEIKQAMAGVISTGGGNVISTGGGNVISTGGGNVISTGGGN